MDVQENCDERTEKTIENTNPDSSSTPIKAKKKPRNKKKEIVSPIQEINPTPVNTPKSTEESPTETINAKKLRLTDSPCSTNSTKKPIDKLKMNSEKFMSFFKKNVIESPISQITGNERFQKLPLKPNMYVYQYPEIIYSSYETFINSINNYDCINDINMTTTKNSLKRTILSRGCVRRIQSQSLSEIKSPDSINSKYKCKYLHFSENIRPAYYGTFSKKSHIINAKCPFAKDTKLLEYEFDSDEEWEEEQGESLSHSSNEDDDSNNDENDMEGFLVPHGYLSDSEGCVEDDKKHVELVKDETLTNYKNEILQKLKPKIIGCCFTNNQCSNVPVDNPFDTTFIQLVAPDIIDQLDNYKISSYLQLSKKPHHPKIKEISDQDLGDFIKFLHKKPLGMDKIISQFMEFKKSNSSENNLTKNLLVNTIRKISNKYRESDGIIKYFVHDELLLKFNINNNLY